jgi:hypothetical protein
MKWELDMSGDNLVRPATIEEVVPGAQLYMRDVYRVNEFRPTVFHHLMSYESILELFKTGRIYVKGSCIQSESEPSKRNTQRGGSRSKRRDEGGSGSFKMFEE